VNTGLIEQTSVEGLRQL